MTISLVVLAILGAAAAIAIAAVVRSLSRSVDRRLIITTLIGIGIGLAAWVGITHGTAASLGVLLLMGGAGVGWVLWRRGGTASTVTLWGERARRRSGVATPLHIARVASGWAMHRKARAVRPHLRDKGWRDRWRMSTHELAAELCRTSRMRVWAAIEDVVFICGGPRSGKTALLGNLVIDAPGAVVTTSTRTDIVEATEALRAKKGPVWFFNPSGLGEIASTVSFEPVFGCEDPKTALERAADMLPERQDERGESARWDAQSRRVFAAYLHAAALSGGRRDSEDIARWASDPGGTAEEVLLLLRRSPSPGFIPDVKQFVDTNNDTRSSITTGVMPILSWLNSPTAVAATKGGTPFNVAELIRSRGTIYLLGREDGITAPLLAGLTGYIAREARRLAASPSFEGSCRGRLDPPMRFPLDEAARITPVPLPDWTGDFGGSGLQLIIVCQSRADLIERYGKSGTAKVLNNSGTAMYLGGNKDADGNGDLEFWSKLAGDRDEPVKTYNAKGELASKTVRKTPVLSVAQLANLPLWRAVVYTRGMPVAIGRISKVWDRADVQAAARATRESSALPVAQVLTHPSPAPTKSPALQGAAVTHSPTRELTHVAH